MATKKRPLSGGKGKVKDLLVPIQSIGLTKMVRYLSNMFEQAQTPDEFSQLYDTLNDAADALSKIKEMTKQRLVSAVTTQGAVATEKGTRRLEANGWSIEARPHRTGLDDKKVEALLRGKGYDIGIWMDTAITYKASPVKMKLLASEPNPGITTDELDTCNVDLVWALQKPKRVSAETRQLTEGNNGEDY